MVNNLGSHSIGHPKQKKSVYVRVPFRTVSKLSPYSCKCVVTKGILHTVSNTGIYCSSEKFGTVYLVQYIFENSTVSINAPCNACENMACCSSGGILTFLYAVDNLHYVIKQFVSCSHFFFFCKLHSSSNSINKYLTGLGLDISVATSNPPIRECH